MADPVGLVEVSLMEAVIEFDREALAKQRGTVRSQECIIRKLRDEPSCVPDRGPAGD